MTIMATNGVHVNGTLSSREVVLKLFDVKGLKFGDFEMRTGEHTPVYIDMRVIWSYPDLVCAISEYLGNLIEQRSLQCNLLCGLPYQGIPLATYISTKHKIPMLLKRKEQKTWGTRQTVEGHYAPGQTILLVDDVIMTGGCLHEDIQFFHDEGLTVTDTVVFFDREQGGIERIKKVHDVTVHSVVTLSEVLNILEEAGKINKETIEKTKEYLKTNRFDTPEYLKKTISEKK